MNRKWVAVREIPILPAILILRHQIIPGELPDTQAPVELIQADQVGRIIDVLSKDFSLLVGAKE